MKRKIFYPDYDNSILGIPNAFLDYYGVRTKHPALPMLEQALKQNHKNVIFIILDGMGIDMLQHDLPFFSFLRRNIKSEISSVFPPTTVAATTTYYTGLCPVEHGWLAWSPYFKDLKRVVEIFTNKDFYTGEVVAENVSKRMPYVHIFDKIKAVNSNVQLTKIDPANIDPKGAVDIDDFCAKIKKQSQKPGKQFIMAYWGKPDSTSHKFGPYSSEVKTVLKELNSKMKKLCSELQDALIIISADHGHIENANIFLNDYPDLMDCLAAPLGFDTRVQTIFLKKGKEETFVRLFNRYFKDGFILMKSKDALKMNLFGNGKAHPFVKDFLGDYLIISTKGKSLVQRFENDVYSYLPGMHAGLTNKEMLVPLILLEKD